MVQFDKLLLVCIAEYYLRFSFNIRISAASNTTSSCASLAMSSPLHTFDQAYDYHVRDISEIWWHSSHFLNDRQNPTGKIWLGTIATFIWFSMVYICAKFHAFTTKCTIHSILVT